MPRDVTARELLRILDRMSNEGKNLDVPVSLEGCDCFGPWSGYVDLDDEEGTFTLYREPLTTMDPIPRPVDPRIAEARAEGILPP